MCGRFAFYSAKEQIEKAFQVDVSEALTPLYNIAPSMSIPVIRQAPADQNTLSYFRWGLLPSLAKDKKQAQINARYETVHEKPFFRTSFQKRRCLILANGWYEWEKRDAQKQPFYFEHQEKQILSFAGIWTQSMIEDTSIETVAIITCPAEKSIQHVHPRMPLMLNQMQRTRWLSDTSFTSIAMKTIDASHTIPLQHYPVSSYVNSPRHQDLKCMTSIKIEN